jgi:phosphatidylethanolamine/phosphatidyl-N-methylethanolamine N-methyltransferase
MSLTLGIKPDFWSAWLRNPRQMGAVLPSSNDLATAMAAQVPADANLILELGAGTGAVTRALLASGITPDRLVVVEKDIRLAARLMHDFTALRVLAGDATRLRALLGLAHTEGVDSVVSSLPLLSMRAFIRTRVLAEVFAVLAPGGRLIQFTYSPKPPIPESLAEGLGVRGRRVARVLRNLPPASVWVYTR